VDCENSQIQQIDIIRPIYNEKEKKTYNTMLQYNIYLLLTWSYSTYNPENKDT